MIENSLDTYYGILGITEQASVEDIKRAYRKKAKVLHPDRNKSSNANEEFILLNEAYEYLNSSKSGKFKNKRSPISHKEWNSNNREKARQRAREHAQMKYEGYKKTDHYRNAQATITVLEHLYFISSIVVILSPLWGYIFKDWTGFFVGIFFTFISAHYWAGIFTEKITLNFNVFVRSVKIVVRTKNFQFSVLTIINLYTFFIFALNTQLTIFTFILILSSLYLTAYYLIRRKLSFLQSFSKTTIFLGILPTLFNLFFFINFIFARNHTTEKYSFVHKNDWPASAGNTPSRSDKIAYIDLENDKYQEYHWFRMFADFDAMKNKREITYTFADGLFGLRVLKTKEFNK